MFSGFISTIKNVIRIRLKSEIFPKFYLLSQHKMNIIDV